MKALVLISVGAAALGLAAAPAAADEFDGPDCTGIYYDSEGQVIDYLFGACTRGRINQHTMAYTVEALNRALARSFDIETEAQKPDVAELDVIVGEGVHAKAVADAPASAAETRWNSWIDGKYTYNDANNIAFNQDGDMFNGLAGIDYKLTSKFTVGVMASAESTDLKGPVSGLNTSGVGIGPYIGYTLGSHIVLSSSLIGTTIDTKQNDVLNNYRYSSDRLQFSAGANGYWYLGAWRVTPGLNFSWSKEWLREKSNLLPDHYVEVAMLTPSFQLGRTLKLSEMVAVEPWAGAALDWSFVNAVKYNGTPAMDEPTRDLRVQAGLNFTIGKQTQLSFTGELGGLINGFVRTYSGEANLAIQF